MDSGLAQVRWFIQWQDRHLYNNICTLDVFIGWVRNNPGMPVIECGNLLSDF